MLCPSPTLATLFCSGCKIYFPHDAKENFAQQMETGGPWPVTSTLFSTMLLVGGKKRESNVFCKLKAWNFLPFLVAFIFSGEASELWGSCCSQQQQKSYSAQWWHRFSTSDLDAPHAASKLTHSWNFCIYFIKFPLLSNVERSSKATQHPY